MDKPTPEQVLAADGLARLMGYSPENVHDVSEIIAPFLAVRDARIRDLARATELEKAAREMKHPPQDCPHGCDFCTAARLMGARAAAIRKEAGL